MSFQRDLLMDMPMLEMAEVFGNLFFCNCDVAWFNEVILDPNIVWAQDWLVSK